MRKTNIKSNQFQSCLVSLQLSLNCLQACYFKNIDDRPNILKRAMFHRWGL